MMENEIDGYSRRQRLGAHLSELLILFAVAAIAASVKIQSEAAIILGQMDRQARDFIAIFASSEVSLTITFLCIIAAWMALWLLLRLSLRALFAGIILCAIAYVCLLYSLPALSVIDKKPLLGIFSASMLALNGTFPVAVLALMALSRMIRRPMWFLLGAIIMLAALYLGLFFIYAFPHIHGIADPDNLLKQASFATLQPPPFDRLYIPTVCVPLRKLIEVALPFVFAIACARRSFRVWKFCAAYLLAATGLSGIFYGANAFGFPGLLSPLAGLALSLAALYLPLQRQAFERLFGFSLRGEPVDESSGASFALSIVGYTTLIALLAMTALWAAFGYYERELIRVIKSGPDFVPQSPALHNAYDDLKPLYCINKGTYINIAFHSSPTTASRTVIEVGNEKITTTTPNILISQGKLPSSAFIKVYMPSPFSTDNLMGHLPPDLVDMAIATFDQKKIEERFNDIKPFLDAWEKARDADYCRFDTNHGFKPRFLNLRKMVRLIAFRAHLRMSQGRPGDAIHDIESIFQTGWLLDDDCQNLTTYMYGTAFRGMAVGAGHSYYLRHKDDPAAMGLLGDLLERMAPKVRMTFAWERLRRVESALWTISPYLEKQAPSWPRVVAVYYARWIGYDMLVVCVALEKYRKAHGDYPATLDALAPAYLKRLPLDPIQGKPY
ncbi:MAG: hypothetical protein NTX50_31620, partial [Candidatus Sumerlaeota bacterium]|nr:hypothetical protein [Candidatus Sumerlaeota bacterium]